MNLPITIIIFLLFVCYLLCTANEGKLWLGTEVMNLTMQAYRLKQKQSYVVADNCLQAVTAFRPFWHHNNYVMCPENYY